MENESRRMIVFVISAVALLVLYETFVLAPQAKRQQALQQAQAAAAAAQHPAAPAGQAVVAAPDADASRTDPHVSLDSPSLSGQIDLRGGRIDQLSLKHYHTTTDPRSPLVSLFRPAYEPHAWFAQVGWTAANAQDLPDADAILWTAPAGAVLTPKTPLTLTYDTGQGVRFTRTMSVDDNALFTITDQVANSSAQPAKLRAYGLVEQRGLPDDLTRSNIVHEGAIGVLDGKVKLSKYADWKKKGFADLPSTGGWLGITEKYWLAALIPDQSEAITARFPVQQAGDTDVYKSGYLGAPETVAPGQTLTRTTHIFAGAKRVPELQAYGKQLGIPKFDWAVDWGMFWFFTQPLFWLLEFLTRYIGAIGAAILVMTVLVKAVFFPLANKSYESVSKMRKIQPQIEDLKKIHANDATKLQQETMALYQREKINPLMGCLPMLVQIPVFYSLYKVLTVTIEMRQAPFFGWIKDLSAPDPTTIWNLFGVLPWDPLAPGVVHFVTALPFVGGLLLGALHLGVLPLLYGFTMWLSQAMNPPSPDPTQQRILQLMPIMFTFIMAQFTVGLLIYWSWSNVLSILQQYVIMHRFEVENPIDSFLARFTKPKEAG